MLESVHCPTCSAHYGLQASRVRAGLRRARCFRCASVFGIEEQVARLLAAPAEPEAAPLATELPPATPPAESLPEPGLAEPAPSLTLGDLEGIEEEILEKTLVVEPAAAFPERHTGPVPELPASDLSASELSAPELSAPELSASELSASELSAPELSASELSASELSGFDLAVPEPEAKAGEADAAAGFASAKDAIAKLLGDLPAAEAQPERRTLSRAANQMDVEATLDALESTLGGVSAKDLGNGQPPAPAMPEITAGELEPAPAASTLKLTHDEIQSALRASTLPTPAPRPLPPPTPAPISTPPAPTPEATISLLKVRVGDEVYGNVSMDQMTSWIEQGRVQDFHMVARQFSENWIEAGKVPTLRPVFDRVKRQQPQDGAPANPNETAPIKKSLFGGLFNRG